MSDCYKRHADYCSCLLLSSFFFVKLYIAIKRAFYYESRVPARNLRYTIILSEKTIYLCFINQLLQ